MIGNSTIQNPELMMKIYQETVKIPKIAEGKSCLSITELVDKVILSSEFSEGIVLVHTLHTTTALSQRSRPATGYMVQENEKMLMADFQSILDEGAEKLIQALPEIASGRDRFLDFFPQNLMSSFLGMITDILRPSGYWQHDDFKIRTENMHPNERKNATAHVKAAMMREHIVWSFAEKKLNRGRWQDVIFWDFDPEGRTERSIQIVVLGN